VPSSETDFNRKITISGCHLNGQQCVLQPIGVDIAACKAYPLAPVAPELLVQQLIFHLLTILAEHVQTINSHNDDT